MILDGDHLMGWMYRVLKISEEIADVTAEAGVTILLASHYDEDIRTLARRGISCKARAFVKKEREAMEQKKIG